MTVSSDDWEVPPEFQPLPRDYAFDLDRALAAVVGLTSRVPADAFTAPVLGTERAGNGVLVHPDGVVLTIGYLVVEAEEIWLTAGNGRVVPAHVVGYDQPTGFALVQPLGPLDMPGLAMGDSHQAPVGERVVIGGAGGRSHSVAGRVVGRQEFAGYWEYVLDEAIFTAPAHPHWGGAALIGPAGDLLGIASLQVRHDRPSGQTVPLNMVVPIELVKPIFRDLLKLGRADRPPRPWLGLFAAEADGKVMVIGFAGEGPAQRAGLREGDVILAVAGAPVQGLADFYRRVWALGPAGVEVPLTLDREGDIFDVSLRSVDRARLLKAARFH